MNEESQHKSMTKNQTSRFRKIKSLNFLYEISEDGMIVRNVKSKKRVSHRWNFNTYEMIGIVKIKGSEIEFSFYDVFKECWPSKKERKEIIIKNKNEFCSFSSKKECAIFISKKYNTSYETVRQKLKKKRSHIYDYDIIYF